MKKIRNNKTVFIIVALLFMTVPVFADGLPIMGKLPPNGMSGKTEKKSWGNQMKSGFNKLTRSILPEKEKPQKIDELSLSRTAKPSPGLPDFHDMTL